ncbi:hypothetical protein [Candidatus Endomicrobiellum trichonymphae]|uniref:hypothetical protein n=2 Tax=Endomicrobium trichonymphae TaxID=1408204 RepID=UPI0011EA60D5|nr:hypothetical protein [Candidatus Endomicrobium trichonymphae]
MKKNNNAFNSGISCVDVLRKTDTIKIKERLLSAAIMPRRIPQKKNFYESDRNKEIVLRGLSQVWECMWDVAIFHRAEGKLWAVQQAFVAMAVVSGIFLRCLEETILLYSVC